MRIEWIEVENFKGFDKRRFEFDEHFTLFVGENGSGKTSLVEAVAFVVQSFLATMGAGGGSPQMAGLFRMAGHMTGSTAIAEPRLPLRLKASICASGEVHEASFSCPNSADSTSNHAWSEFCYKWHQAAVPFMQSLAKLSDVLPVFTSYPAKRSSTSGSRPDFNNIMGAKPQRFGGYLGWSWSEGVATSFTEWLARHEAIGREDQSDSALFTSTKAAIMAACPGMKNIRFSVKRGEPVIEWENGDMVGFSLLSDGQKSILTMVADIARRAAMLNPDLENPVAETPGVVVIDEIDLHLHPRWQRRIMADLRRVFPKIQFIATTHSPIIISAAKDALVVRLDPTGATVLGQAYGLDVNWVVDELQGGDSQSPEVKALVMKADELIDEGQMDEAQKIVEQLRDIQQGCSTDTVRLEATINNIIALAHAED